MPDLTPEEERWRTALQNADFGMWDLDPKNETVRYSPQWKARLGFAQIDSPDRTSFWRSLVHPDDFNPMLRGLRLHMDGYTPTYEMRFRLRAGNFRYVSVLSRGRVVERDEQGDALRIIGTMIDLTQRWPAPPAPRADLPRPRRDLMSFIDPAARQLREQVGDLLDIAVRDGE
jgi:PAS domain S-box-containing protein